MIKEKVARLSEMSKSPWRPTKMSKNAGMSGVSGTLNGGMASNVVEA